LLLNSQINLCDIKYDVANIKDKIFIELNKLKIYLNLINNTYSKVINFKTLMTQYNKYQNSLLRGNIKYNNFHDFINGFKTFLKEDKEHLNSAEKRITFVIDNIESFEFIYTIMYQIELIKSLFLEKLNEMMNIESFIRFADNSIKRIGQEGFVVSDSNLTIKLVNRYEFSSYNFSDTIMKPK
jgi:hypothetical protein